MTTSFCHMHQTLFLVVRKGSLFLWLGAIAAVMTGCTLAIVHDPFQANIGLGMNPGTLSSNFEITVPDGKRLVVESVTARATLPTGQHVILSISTTTSERDALHYIALSPQGTFPTYDAYAATSSLRIYADAGTTIHFEARRSADVGVANINTVISGQYLAMP